jgi:hypothetical protein
MTAMSNPRIKERATDTTDSCSVTFTPDRIHSKYCPEVMIAQSK